MENKEELEKYYQKCQDQSKMLRGKGIPLFKQKEDSYFVRKIKAISRDTKVLIGPEPSGWFNRDIWPERYIQLKILELALKDLSEGYVNEKSLEHDCNVIKKFSTWRIASDYNEFPRRLTDLLETIHPLQMDQTSGLNMQMITEFKEKEEEEINSLACKAKVVYAQMLQENPTLMRVEESLQQPSGDQVLYKVIGTVKGLVSKELLEIKVELENKLTTIEQNNQAMNISFSYITNELRRATDMLAKFENKYPDDFKQFAEEKPSAPDTPTFQRQLKDPTEVTKTLANRNLFSRNTLPRVVITKNGIPIGKQPEITDSSAEFVPIDLRA